MLENHAEQTSLNGWFMRRKLLDVYAILDYRGVLNLNFLEM